MADMNYVYDQAEFPDRFRHLLKEKRMNQKMLAEEASINPSTITRWLNGTTRPTGKKFQRVLDVLGVSASFFAIKDDDQAELVLNNQMEFYEEMQQKAACGMTADRTAEVDIISEYDPNIYEMILFLRKLGYDFRYHAKGEENEIDSVNNSVDYYYNSLKKCYERVFQKKYEAIEWDIYNLIQEKKVIYDDTYTARKVAYHLKKTRVYRLKSYAKSFLSGINDLMDDIDCYEVSLSDIQKDRILDIKKDIVNANNSELRFVLYRSLSQLKALMSDIKYMDGIEYIRDRIRWLNGICGVNRYENREKINTIENDISQFDFHVGALKTLSGSSIENEIIIPKRKKISDEWKKCLSELEVMKSGLGSICLDDYLEVSDMETASISSSVDSMTWQLSERKLVAIDDKRVRTHKYFSSKYYSMIEDDKLSKKWCVDIYHQRNDGNDEMDFVGTMNLTKLEDIATQLIDYVDYLFGE